LTDSYSIRPTGTTVFYPIDSVTNDNTLQLKIPYEGETIAATSFDVLITNFAGQLVLFTLTTTSNISVVDSLSTGNFNLDVEGSANKLIFNNNLEVITAQGQANEANRVIIAADLFYTKNRRLLVNQKV
jgi:hypothetical protein